MRNTLPFSYNMTFNALASGGSANAQTGTLRIQSDSDFEVQRIMSTVAISLVALSTDSYLSILEGYHYGGLTVQITDTGTGRKWFSTDVPIPSVFGTGQTPFTLPQTLVLAKNTSLQFTVTNNYTAGAGNTVAYINFTLFGRKIFV